MSFFVVIVLVVGIFVDAGEIEYISLAEHPFQVCNVFRMDADLVIIRTDNDFHGSMMFLAYLFYLFQKLLLPFPDNLRR